MSCTRLSKKFYFIQEKFCKNYSFHGEKILNQSSQIDHELGDRNVSTSEALGGFMIILIYVLEIYESVVSARYLDTKI